MLVLQLYALVLVLYSLAAVLPGPVAAGANDPWMKDGQWHVDPNLTWCPDGQTCVVDRTKTYACYPRMQEAMGLMDIYLRSRGMLPTGMSGKQIEEQWDAVMRECVR